MGARYTPFVECPNCRRLLKVGIRRCSKCYEEVTDEYGLNSALVVIFNTVACDIANSIRSTDMFAIFASIGSVLIFLLDGYVFGSPSLSLMILIWPLIPIVMIALWYYRFGRFALGDDEYVNAKKGLSRMLLVWLAILAVQLMVVASWLK
jgi:RNA polymerase subunit RPABC4/transcription elongation factor Spt4